MITTAILYVIYGIVYVVAQPILLLNDVSIPAGITDAVNNIASYLAPLDGFLPVATILIIMGISVSIEGSYLLYKLIMWIIKRFPTQS